MKLFLSSLAISKSQAEHFELLVGKPAEQIKLALVENAADVYAEDSRDWVVEHRNAIVNNGYQIEQIDLHNYSNDLDGLEQKLSGVDVVWMGGGNTYYLRWLLQDTGIDKVLIKLIKEDGLVYGGGSAGAIITGPTIKHFEKADNPDEAPEMIYEGLNLINEVIVPHTDNEKFENVMKEIILSLEKDGYKTIPITDEEAIIVNNDKLTKI